MSETAEKTLVSNGGDGSRESSSHHNPNSPPEEEEEEKVEIKDDRVSNLNNNSINHQMSIRDEAEAVLDALPGGTSYLDGFSLLQVIANPRGNPEDLLSPSSSSNPSSFHGRYGSTTGAGSSTADSTDIFTGTFQSIESTVVHVTDQMNFFNSMLDGWSRSLLEEDPFGSNSGGVDIPESQLRELPPALRSLSLHDLESYLDKSGLLAHAFRDRQPIMEKKDFVEEAPTPKVLAKLREQVPEVFWDTENPVDLTDTATFREVFLASDPTITSEKVETTASVFDFLPLVPEESLNPWLDQIELALLEAVREKSSDFFVESVRFGKLQQEIHALLTQVQQAQSDVNQVQNNLVNPSLALPRLDQERRDCQRLLLILDQVQDMLQAKASIPGYLSAADDLTALEQVQYGRKQLTEYDKADENMLGRRRPLSNLTALQGVAKQLDQYQDLIVTNLREELVEVFMDWNSNSTGLPPNHDRIQDIVKALHNCQGWDATWQAYRNRLHDVLRLTLRTIVGEFSTSPTSSLTVAAFLECLDVTTEQFTTLLRAAVAVKAYCLQHNVFVDLEETKKTDDEAKVREGEDTNDAEEETKNDKNTSETIDDKASGVVISSAELAAKSVSELLRLRKEAHSLVSLDEMKMIWDKCSSFSEQLEELTGAKATAMRSALLSQTKAFAERQHEKHMSSLAAALDSERWTQCQVSAERQEKISRLCTGRAILSRGFSNSGEANGSSDDRKPDVLVGGVHYKVVWSCLLLIEMIMNDLSTAAHFTGLSTLMVTKVSELLRLFNARTTQLVLGAGAIHSAARLKSINAKHLSLVTQCLGMVIAVFPHIRAALMAHLPTKQHMLLTSIDAIKKEYAEHNENVLNKFVTIIGGIVEHGLAPKLAGTDFDVRAEKIPLGDDGSVPSCVFFDGVSVNTKKMHQVLFGLLPPDHLQDVFSRIFAFIDQKVPTIIVQATKGHPSKPAGGNKSPQRQMSGPRFTFPTTDAGKRRLLLEAEAMTKNLNGLEGVQPWDFSAVNVLENRVEYSLRGDHAIAGSQRDDEDEVKTDDGEGAGETQVDLVDGERVSKTDSAPNEDSTGVDPGTRNDEDEVKTDVEAVGAMRAESESLDRTDENGDEEGSDDSKPADSAPKEDSSGADGTGEAGEDAMSPTEEDVGRKGVVEDTDQSVDDRAIRDKEKNAASVVTSPSEENGKEGGEDNKSEENAADGTESKAVDSEAETDVTTDPGDSTPNSPDTVSQRQNGVSRDQEIKPKADRITEKEEEEDTSAGANAPESPAEVTTL